MGGIAKSADEFGKTDIGKAGRGARDAARYAAGEVAAGRMDPVTGINVAQNGAQQKLNDLLAPPVKDVAAPPPAPDLTDDLVRQARRAELARLMAGRGRKSTFLGSQTADSPALGKTSLGGY